MIIFDLDIILTIYALISNSTGTPDIIGQFLFNYIELVHSLHTVITFSSVTRSVNMYWRIYNSINNNLSILIYCY